MDNWLGKIGEESFQAFQLSHIIMLASYLGNGKIVWKER